MPILRRRRLVHSWIVVASTLASDGSRVAVTGRATTPDVLTATGACSPGSLRAPDSPGAAGGAESLVAAGGEPAAGGSGAGLSGAAAGWTASGDLAVCGGTTGCGRVSAGGPAAPSGTTGWGLVSAGCASGRSGVLPGPGPVTGSAPPPDASAIAPPPSVAIPGPASGDPAGCWRTACPGCGRRRIVEENAAVRRQAPVVLAHTYYPHRRKEAFAASLAKHSTGRSHISTDMTKWLRSTRNATNCADRATGHHDRH